MGGTSDANDEPAVDVVAEHLSGTFVGVRVHGQPVAVAGQLKPAVRTADYTEDPLDPGNRSPDGGARAQSAAARRVRRSPWNGL